MPQLHILLGQALGLIVVIISFISYQAKTQRGIVLINLVATAVNAAHYLLLGSLPGAILNFVCIVRNLIYYNKEKRLFSSRAIPYVLAAAIAALAALSWEGPVTLLLAAALMINTVFLSLDNAQTFRKSIILTSSMIFLYNIILGSVGGCINEAIAVISAIIGIIRFSKDRPLKEENDG
jgi:hypothetical protein